MFDCLKCHILKLHCSDFLLLPVIFLFFAGIAVLCHKTILMAIAIASEFFM
jgi:hypothetical protein